MKRKHWLWAILALLLVLILIPVGIYRSAIEMRDDVIDSFRLDKRGFSISNTIAAQADQANNLLKVVTRVENLPPEVSAHCETLKGIIASVEAETSPTALIELNQKLMKELSTVFADLAEVKMSDLDAKAAQNIQLEIQSKQAQIEHSNYHQKVKAYNKKLESFPLSLFVNFGILDPLPLFREENLSE